MSCDFRGGEKQEKQQKNEKMKPKVRRHHTSKSDEPDLQESAFLKKIIAYQRKLLVQEILLSFFISFCQWWVPAVKIVFYSPTVNVVRVSTITGHMGFEQ